MYCSIVRIPTGEDDRSDGTNNENVMNVNSILENERETLFTIAKEIQSFSKISRNLKIGMTHDTFSVRAVPTTKLKIGSNAGDVA